MEARATRIRRHSTGMEARGGVRRVEHRPEGPRGAEGGAGRRRGGPGRRLAANPGRGGDQIRGGVARGVVGEPRRRRPDPGPGATRSGGVAATGRGRARVEQEARAARIREARRRRELGRGDPVQILDSSCSSGGWWRDGPRGGGATAHGAAARRPERATGRTGRHRMMISVRMGVTRTSTPTKMEKMLLVAAPTTTTRRRPPPGAKIAPPGGSGSGENGEDIQVLRYKHGEKYEQHYDYFTDNVNTIRGGHRVATVLMYLTDVAEGGETGFPLAEEFTDSGSDNKDATLSECAQKGIAVKPRKGDALLFFNLSPDGTADSLSLHAGCPVIKGEKWSATKWIRVASFDKVYHAQGNCTDDNESCAKWAARGECTKNPEYMVGTAALPGYCRRSCNVC